MFNTLSIEDCRLKAVDIQMQYQVIHGQTTVNYSSKFPTYINIIVPEHGLNIGYSIEDASYILNKGEHIIHFLAEDSNVTIKSRGSENGIILIVIPADKLDLFNRKYQQDAARFNNGFLTKSDPRIALNIKQIL